MEFFICTRVIILKCDCIVLVSAKVETRAITVLTLILMCVLLHRELSQKYKEYQISDASLYFILFFIYGLITDIR